MFCLMVDFNGSLVFVSTTFSYLDNADWLFSFPRLLALSLFSSSCCRTLSASVSKADCSSNCVLSFMYLQNPVSVTDFISFSSVVY